MAPGIAMPTGRSRSRPSGAALLLASTLATAPLAAAVQTTPPAQGVPTFEATAELVYVRFHVETRAGYAKTLAKEQLRVLEDGKPQAIALLETPSTRERTVPPEITLALDVSSSVMDAQLLDERLVRDVLFASLSEQARVGLCAFGGQLRCFAPPTREPQAVLDGFQQALRFAGETRHTGTRLYASLTDLAQGGGARAAPSQPPRPCRTRRSVRSSSSPMGWTPWTASGSRPSRRRGRRTCASTR